jgi:anti-sigma factor RsiW
MNPEYLESLVLDRTLGELSPAVAALLDEHLARNPDAARRATELQATVALARRAVVSPTQAPQQALDVERLRRALPPTAASPARRTELYRLAACLAVGLGLGWFAPPAPGPLNVDSTSLPSREIAAAAPTEPRSTFWSVARLTASQRTGTPNGPATGFPLR